MKSGIGAVASMLTFGRSAYSTATTTKAVKINVQLITRHKWSSVLAKLVHSNIFLHVPEVTLTYHLFI